MFGFEISQGDFIMVAEGSHIVVGRVKRLEDTYVLAEFMDGDFGYYFCRVSSCAKVTHPLAEERLKEKFLSHDRLNVKNG